MGNGRGRSKYGPIVSTGGGGKGMVDGLTEDPESKVVRQFDGQKQYL